MSPRASGFVMVPDTLDAQVAEAGCPSPDTCVKIFRAIDPATYAPGAGARPPHGLTTSEAVHRTDLSPSTVKRHLSHLTGAGFAYQAAPGRGRREAVWSAHNPERRGFNGPAANTSVVSPTPSKTKKVHAVAGSSRVTSRVTNAPPTALTSDASPPAEVGAVAGSPPPEVHAVAESWATDASTWPEVTAPGSGGVPSAEDAPYVARYLTTNYPPPPVLYGEPWPFAPRRDWETLPDSTGICRPSKFGLSVCAECRTTPGEHWPGQAHAYCDTCRGVPARPALPPLLSA